MEESVATSSLTIYKYTSPKYADALLKRGAVRIGTLFDYRRDEHPSAVGDASEGQDPLLLHYDGVLPDRPENRPAIVRAVFSDKTGGGAVLDRVVFEAKRSSENCFVYSVGLSWNERGLKEFGGACVRITNFERFTNRLASSIRKRHSGEILEAGFAMCAYRAKGRRYSDHDMKIHPAWIKALEYGWQDEARVLWRVTNAEKLEPLAFEDRALRKGCVRIA